MWKDPGSSEREGGQNVLSTPPLKIPSIIRQRIVVPGFINGPKLQRFSRPATGSGRWGSIGPATGDPRVSSPTARSSSTGGESRGALSLPNQRRGENLVRSDLRKTVSTQRHQEKMSVSSLRGERTERRRKSDR